MEKLRNESDEKMMNAQIQFVKFANGCNWKFMVCQSSADYSTIRFYFLGRGQDEDDFLGRPPEP